MDREELYRELDIESPEEFEYFEQYATLLECLDEIEYDDFYQALSMAKADSMAEITENYFTELEKNLPDGHDEIYEIIENVFTNLKLIVGDIDSAEDSRREFIQKLFTFHEWYTKPDGALFDNRACSVVEAIFEFRAQKLDNSKHDYSFENSMDYQFDYVSMPVGGYYEDEE